MVDQNKTEVICLIDETGSMQGYEEDVVGSVNGFLDEQKDLDVEDDCKITFRFFSSRLGGDSDVVTTDGNRITNPWEDEVHRIDLGNIKHLETDNYNPSGMTPLLDSLAGTIKEFGQKFADMEETNRPGNVIMYIYTDGKENSSVEYSKEQIQSLVDEHENVWDWEFIFVESSPEAFGQGQEFGFSVDAVSQFEDQGRGCIASTNDLSERVACARES